MKQFADALLSMTDGSTLSKDKLSVTKTSAGYCVAFAGSTATTSFTLDELKAEAKLDLERKSKRTVLVKSEGQYKTDFYAKNSLTLPTDTALIIVEIANFVTFAKDPSKAASDNITRDRLNSQDRSKELFGFVKEDGKWERGEVQKCLTTQVKQYKWEKAKAQAAQLCGGAKVVSRGNHIDFQASCINPKTGKIKSFRSSNRQFEKQGANPRVNFKAKENYNSSGAVRGGNTALVPVSKELKPVVTISELINKAIPEFNMKGAVHQANQKAAKKALRQALRRNKSANKLEKVIVKPFKKEVKEVKNVVIPVTPLAPIMIQPKGSKTNIIFKKKVKIQDDPKKETPNLLSF